MQRCAHSFLQLLISSFVMSSADMMIHHWRLFKIPSSLKSHGCCLIGLWHSLRCQDGKQPGSTWLRKPHLQHTHALGNMLNVFPLVYMSPYMKKRALAYCLNNSASLSAHRLSLFNLCGKCDMIFQTQADRQMCLCRHEADVQS